MRYDLNLGNTDTTVKSSPTELKINEISELDS